MVSTLQRNTNPLHRLARFVSKQAAAIMFDLAVEEIYSVERWAHIVYVRGRGVSRFVSYADFPPKLGVAPPTDKDFALWRRRWRQRQRQQQKKHSPPFWLQFFAARFHQSPSIEVLHNWGKSIGFIKFAFNEDTLQRLRQSYRQKQLAVISH